MNTQTLCLFVLFSLTHKLECWTDMASLPFLVASFPRLLSNRFPLSQRVPVLFLFWQHTVPYYTSTQKSLADFITLFCIMRCNGNQPSACSLCSILSLHNEGIWLLGDLKWRFCFLTPLAVIDALLQPGTVHWALIKINSRGELIKQSLDLSFFFCSAVFVFKWWSMVVFFLWGNVLGIKIPCRTRLNTAPNNIFYGRKKNCSDFGLKMYEMYLQTISQCCCFRELQGVWFYTLDWKVRANSVMSIRHVDLLYSMYR